MAVNTYLTLIYTKKHKYYKLLFFLWAKNNFVQRYGLDIQYRHELYTVSVLFSSAESQL